jgi:hypothetical protein
MRHLSFSLISILLITTACSFSDLSQKEVDERKLVMQRVDDAVKAKDYAALNAMEQEFLTQQSRTPGGQWKLTWFYTGFSNSMPIEPATGCRNNLQSFASGWAKAFPREPAPPIIEANSLVNYGACMRGEEAASRTAGSSLAIFESYGKAAKQLLESRRATASLDPEYYAVMIRAFGAIGSNQSAVLRLVDEATARQPYYYETYASAAHYFMPQWYGSWADIDSLGRYAVRHTEQKEGSGAYARVMWSLEEWGGLDLQAVDWPTMAQSMEDIYKVYPTDWNAASIMKFACEKGDRALAAKYAAKRSAQDWLAWSDQSEWQTCSDFAKGYL